MLKNKIHHSSFVIIYLWLYLIQQWWESWFKSCRIHTQVWCGHPVRRELERYPYEPNAHTKLAYMSLGHLEILGSCRTIKRDIFLKTVSYNFFPYLWRTWHGDIYKPETAKIVTKEIYLFRERRFTMLFHMTLSHWNHSIYLKGYWSPILMYNHVLIWVIK